MARSVTTIQNEIISAVNNNTNLTDLNSTSAVAIWRLWAYIVASSMATEEQLYDQFRADIEALQLQLAPATLPWIQAQAFKFQYSDTVPQVIQLNTSTFTPEYPDGVNTAYQIITNCSVTQGVLNSVNIKVAKGFTTTSLPQALASTELAAFQYYMNLIKPAGIVYNCISETADRLKTAATVYYKAIYAGTIASQLQTAYNNYLQSIPFDGKVLVVDLLIALRQVTGVTDVYINDCVIRAYSNPFPGGVAMVSSNTTNYPEYATIAGYIVDEDTSGNTFTDLLTLIAI